MSSLLKAGGSADGAQVGRPTPLSRVDPLAETDMLSDQVYRSIIRLVTRGQLHRGAALRIEEL